MSFSLRVSSALRRPRPHHTTQIAHSCHRVSVKWTRSLYEQDAVVVEWEDFLEGIISVPRPPPTERQYGLAVDAANFSSKLPWCRFVFVSNRQVNVRVGSSTRGAGDVDPKSNFLGAGVFSSQNRTGRC